LERDLLFLCEPLELLLVKLLLLLSEIVIEGVRRRPLVRTHDKAGYKEVPLDLPGFSRINEGEPRLVELMAKRSVQRGEPNRVLPNELISEDGIVVPHFD